MKTYKQFQKDLSENLLPGKVRGLARGTKARVGFTGMNAQGFNAMMQGQNYMPSSKPQILGKGAYSAPTLKGAKRYAGTSGSLGGRQTPGGVVRSIVPSNAPKINFLEPQSKTTGAMFDKGRDLATKLMDKNYRPNSATANKLRMQMKTGSSVVPRGLNLKGIRGGPLSTALNMATGAALDKYVVQPVAKAGGNALARTLLDLTGKGNRARQVAPSLYGKSGPDLTPDIVKGIQQRRKLK